MHLYIIATFLLASTELYLGKKQCTNPSPYSGENRISCYVCEHEYGTSDSDVAFCLQPKQHVMFESNQTGHVQKVFRTKEGNSKIAGYTCPSSEMTYCQATVTLMSNVVAKVQRGCATECDMTDGQCRHFGYGVDISECTFCCSGNWCNNWEDLHFYAGDIRYFCH